MKPLAFQLKQMCRHNADGSFATQADREKMFEQFASQLLALGFLHMNANSLKQKHVDALLSLWKGQGISDGTIKNRMSALRWWSEKIGKENLIKRDNASYGIADRKFVCNESKAKTIQPEQLAKVADVRTATSLRLQAAFGLRREESIKICPRWADRDSVLHLKSSWTKGGKSREIPIRTAEQRAALDAAKAVAGSGSLIPKELRYKDQMNRFKAQCQQAGISNVHGLRHQYAQTRYQELTGWACPVQGGLRSKQMSLEQKHADREARLMISKELGHEREQIVAQYIGR